MFGKKKNPEDQSPERLLGLWQAKFDAPMHPDLLREIEDWKMDRRGNFTFTMNTGRTLFVGHKKTDDSGGKVKPVVESYGRMFSRSSDRDPFHVMLAQHSLGNRRIKFQEGSKNHKARMWAAAKIMDIEVENYEPDARALEYLDQFRRDFQR